MGSDSEQVLRNYANTSYITPFRHVKLWNEAERKLEESLDAALESAPSGPPFNVITRWDLA